MSATLEFAKTLINRPSVTPNDEGCQALIAERLTPHGFTCLSLPFEEVSNLYASHGNSGSMLLFAGHTDVVPTGPIESWTFDPFKATEHDGKLYGRGAADMKSSVAAMVIAFEQYVNEYPNHNGTLALLLTSDEEGPAINGTVKAIDALKQQGIQFEYCIIGEPSSTNQLGDVIKIGRRGSLNGTVKIQGKQGHIAYPHLADNPIHKALTALDALVVETWDKGHEDFPQTSFQLSNIHSGTGTSNVIPDTLEATFNFRFSPSVSSEALQKRVADIFEKFEVNYEIDWRLSGQPFITQKPELIDATVNAIKKVKGIQHELSTTGGTSDGRFIAPTGCQVVELGPTNATIHQIDEHVNIDQLDELTQMYFLIIEQLLS